MTNNGWDTFHLCHFFFARTKCFISHQNFWVVKNKTILYMSWIN